MSRDRLAAMRAQRSAERSRGAGASGEGNDDRYGSAPSGRYGGTDAGYNSGLSQGYPAGRESNDIPPPGPPSYQSYAADPSDDLRARSNNYNRRQDVPQGVYQAYGSAPPEEDEEARGQRARDQRRRRPSQAAAMHDMVQPTDYGIPPPPVPSIPEPPAQQQYRSSPPRGQPQYMNQDPYGTRQDDDYWDKNQSAVSLANTSETGYSDAKLQKKKSLRKPPAERQQGRGQHEEYEIPELRRADRSPPQMQQQQSQPQSPYYQQQASTMPPSQSMQGYPSTAGSNNPNLQSNAPDVSMTEFFESIDSVRGGLADFAQCITYLDQLHSKNLAGNLNSDEVQSELEQVAEDTRKLSASLRNAIKELQETTRIRTHGQKEQERQTRKVQIAAVREKFVENVQNYQTMEMKYREKAKQRIERQYAIVNPNATQEELRAVVDGSDGQEVQVFAQALRQNKRVADARGVLNEVQNRHEDIKKIERTLVELFQLFQDMAIMVEEQDETIIHIEQKAEEVAKDMEVGNSEIQKAVVSAKGARKKRKICCCIMVILLLIIGGVVAYVVVKVIIPKVNEAKNNNGDGENSQARAVEQQSSAGAQAAASAAADSQEDGSGSSGEQGASDNTAEASSPTARLVRRHKYRDLVD